MNTTRRDFLRYCGMSAAALGLTATDLLHLDEVLANPNAPAVLWLQGAACTGCSVSLLNRVSSARPTTAADLLINSINLAYHPNLMSAAGELAVQGCDQAYAKGGYILVVEGGVPTAFGGAACWAWTVGGQDVTFATAVSRLASRAAHTVCVGSCASFGGIPAAGSNQAGIRGVGAYTARPTINVPGCPPHPDWMVWTFAQLLLNKPVTLDSQRRPTALYPRKIHEVCPLKGTSPAKALGVASRCLKEVGCKGPETKAACASQFFNGGVNWCIGAGAPCIGCTESRFPGTESFYKSENLD
jgi:hydrogenase small subunit